jgi:6-phosphogluconolactonase
MKRYRIGRTALATMMSLALGLGVTACSRDYTVAYVYATSAQTGTVSAFDVDFQSGSLVQIAGSPFTSNLHNPVTLVVTPSNKFLYVIGGSQDDAIAEMAIGTDGKLYGQHTYSIGGHSSTAAAIDPAGKFLYVTFTLQSAFTSVSGGPGGVAIFPINADNSLGNPTTLNLGLNPVGVVASPLNNFIYILDADQTSTGVGAGQLLSFKQNTTTGALTPVTCASPCVSTVLGTSGGISTATGNSAGTTPTGIAEDATARFVYVTDRATNQIYGYTVQGATAPGALVPLNFGPFATGQFPLSLTIDPRGKYLYMANFGSNTISSYALDTSSGNLSATSAANGTAATGPTCVAIEPALGIYLYTSNRLDGSLSGAQLDPHTGGLTAIENTPFSAAAQLSCVAAAANGEHAQSLVTP